MVEKQETTLKSGDYVQSGDKRVRKKATVVKPSEGSDTDWINKKEDIPFWVNIEEVLGYKLGKGRIGDKAYTRINNYVDAVRAGKIYNPDYPGTIQTPPTEEKPVEESPGSEDVNSPKEDNSEKDSPVEETSKKKQTRVKEPVKVENTTFIPGKNAETIPGIDIDNILPEKNCPFCLGEGAILIEGEKVTCKCVEEKICLRYFTRRYNGIPQAKVDISFYVGKDILIEKASDYTFTGIVKKLLYQTLPEKEKYTHRTVTPSDLSNAYYNKVEEEEGVLLRDIVESVHYLFIVMKVDLPNRSYINIIKNLVETRKAIGKVTWVFAPEGTDSKCFRDMYSVELAKYIEQSFAHPSAPTKK